MNYENFVSSKRLSTKYFGFEVEIDNVSPVLFDFQKQIVQWALKLGRAAIFADTGLGKTGMQLTWASHIANKTGGNVLILAPLCVAHQTVNEGKKFDVEVNYCRSQDQVKSGVNITNYEMLKNFDVSTFSGIVLDESSILKSYMGKTKREIIEACQAVEYRLACTATPSPNDYLELGNHAEFLGIMPSNEMIMRFFQNDTMEAGTYVLKAHAATKFWEWCATWSMCVSNPADLGFDGTSYILPHLHQEFIEVSTEGLPPTEGELFRTVVINATSIHKEGRITIERRADEVAKLANSNDEPWLIWCNTNYEADALKGLIPDAVDLRGSDTIEKKESALDGFIDGSIRVLITKPSIAGMGLNLQHCRNMAFVGLSYSYEDYYQAIRRCYRFGQKKQVNCYVMAADSERSILKIINEKEAKHHTMKAEMTKAISGAHLRKTLINDQPYHGFVEGEGFKLHHGDCVNVATKMESNSVGFSVYSPPFSNLYIYSDSEYDMGNSADDGQFMEHYSYLAEELYRITKPGRLTAIHCKDLPMYKGRDGAAGLRDFPGEIIKMYESKGWQYHSRVTIWKDPVIEMQRTKNHGLLYKQLCKDSAASRQGMADYMIVMRKWDDEEQWESVTRDGGERFFDYIGSSAHAPTAKDLVRARNDKERERLYSIAVWQRYASPVWFDIDQTDVLNYQLARENNEERHICPLQLGLIERSIELWSNPGDLVFSPFTGIGSEGYVALKMGRKFEGAELKKSYFEIAKRNLDGVNKVTGDLFANLDDDAA
jgi:DNA modification methylase/superfamily II DNA or RNA helicase